MNKFSVKIFNNLRNERASAEIYYDDVLWAEISQEGEQPLITLFQHQSENNREFPLEQFTMIIKRAKTKLLIRNNKGSFLDKMAPPDPKQVNKQAEKILVEILSHPEKKIIREITHRFGEVVSIYEPQGKGARYSTEGEFICFLEK